MDTQTENNKRIAKNTLLLYIRMLLTMCISLYTSRIVLSTLGIEDYGIYNVVGGIVSMFSFINGGMISATQRYITYEIGRNNTDKLKIVFSTAIQIHAIISIIVLLFAETVGIWLLKEKMVIPIERSIAAMFVYQCSIITCIINIMSVPYNADIIAHEKMSAFAYISVVEVLFKLFIAYGITLLQYDKLIIYSILMLLAQLLIRFIYSYYCKKHFEESIYNHRFNYPVFREMFSFAGWSFVGNLASVLYTQGLNLMLNIFFGPVINAARGIAVQVQGVIQQFVVNFQMALNPQITKNYANGYIAEMQSLISRSARFSFFLLYMLTLPILLETEFILNIWLKEVPDYSVIFTRLMILISLAYTLSNPCMVANQATGKIKIYQIIIGGILLTILPLSYIALKLGAPAYIVFVIHLCIEIIAQFLRIYLLKDSIKLSIVRYIKEIYMPIILTVSISVLIPYYISTIIVSNWLRFILVAFTSYVSVALISFFFGLSKNEKIFVLEKIIKTHICLKRK